MYHTDHFCYYVIESNDGAVKFKQTYDNSMNS